MGKIRRKDERRKVDGKYWTALADETIPTDSTVEILEINSTKLKVKRIYNILKNYNLHELEDSLLFAVLYNTIINKSDYEKVKQIVKGRSK